MFNFPYFGYPYHNPYYKYYRSPSNYVNIQKNAYTSKLTETSEENSTTSQNSIDNKAIYKEENFENDYSKVKENVPDYDACNSLDNNNESDKPIFELFGIKLYSDDLIILAVLFLLYEQNVKDEMLYIILFLLLFS